MGQPKRIENAKILVANTAMDTDKVKIYGARVRVDSMQKARAYDCLNPKSHKPIWDFPLTPETLRKSFDLEPWPPPAAPQPAGCWGDADALPVPCCGLKQGHQAYIRSCLSATGMCGAHVLPGRHHTPSCQCNMLGCWLIAPLAGASSRAAFSPAILRPCKYWCEACEMWEKKPKR